VDCLSATKLFMAHFLYVYGSQGGPANFCHIVFQCTEYTEYTGLDYHSENCQNNQTAVKIWLLKMSRTLIKARKTFISE
jgi:hypothetical protein